MGIYAKDKKVNDLKVGNKDLVVMMQDNHILALGTKYWAVDLGTLSWSTPNATGNSYAKVENAITGAISYLAGYERQNGATNMPNGTAGFNVAQNFFYLTNSDFIGKSASDVANALSGVWMVYEFNRTFYEKVDLGTLTYEYYAGYVDFNTTDLMGIVKVPDDNDTAVKASILSYGVVANNYFNSHYEEDKKFCVATNGVFKIRILEVTDAAEAKRKLKGITMLYEQAE